MSDHWDVSERCPSERHDGDPRIAWATVSGILRDPVTGESQEAAFCPSCARLLLTLGYFLPSVLAP